MNIERLDGALENIIGEKKVPGLGVIVYRDGEEIYSKFLGRRIIDKNFSKLVTRQSRFRAASVSKIFTKETRRNED